MVFLVVLLQTTVPTVCHPWTILALVWLAIRVRDQMLSTAFPRKEPFLTETTLIRFQALVDVPGMLQQITGRRESLTTLLASVRLLF